MCKNWYALQTMYIKLEQKRHKCTTILGLTPKLYLIEAQNAVNVSSKQTGKQKQIIKQNGFSHEFICVKHVLRKGTATWGKNFKRFYGTNQDFIDSLFTKSYVEIIAK